MTVLLGNNVVADTDESGNLGNNNEIHARQFVAIADGNADQAVVNLRSVGREVIIILYDASDNVLSTGTIASSVDGDNTIALSPVVPISSGTTYRLGIFPDNFTGWRGTGSSEFWPKQVSTYPTVPDPFVSGGSTSQSTTPRFFVQSSAPSYTITSIDGDNNVQAGQTNVDIVMTATTGVTVTTLGGETLTINGVS